jgi:hypothetical protein
LSRNFSKEEILEVAFRDFISAISRNLRKVPSEVNTQRILRGGPANTI